MLKGNVSLGCILAPPSADSVTTHSSENGDNEVTGRYLDTVVKIIFLLATVGTVRSVIF